MGSSAMEMVQGRAQTWEGVCVGKNQESCRRAWCVQMFEKDRLECGGRMREALVPPVLA